MTVAPLDSTFVRSSEIASPESSPARALLRALVDTRDRQVQKARIAFNNREYALEHGSDEAPARILAMITAYRNIFDEIEEKLGKDIAWLVEITEPDIFKQVTCVRGIGPQLSAKLLSLIDIEQCNTVSALWRFAGLAVFQKPCTTCADPDNPDDECKMCKGTGIFGERERNVAGEKSHFSKRLKTTMYVVGMSFVKSRSPYRQLYDNARAYYLQTHPEWSKLHNHQAALRKMNKIFLSHMWERWRKVRGLAVRDPFVLDQLGHTNRLLPSEFGWPEQ